MRRADALHWPVALALTTAAGLIAALLGGRRLYVFSWIALLIPLAVLIVCWRRARQQ